VLATLACGQQAPEYVLRGWTVTPSLTPTVQASSTYVPPTQTPYVIQITNTPEPTNEVSTKCVSASVAVHLRPSPSTDNYPVEVLANGAKVTDLGGRDGKWVFVQVGDKQGWINSEYLTQC
jgi:hypothetical protein